MTTCRQSKSDIRKLRVAGQTYERVDASKYLSTIEDSNNGIEKEVATRIHSIKA